MNADTGPVRVTLQLAAEPGEDLPDEGHFSRWVRAALTGSGKELPTAACVTIRIVDAAESAQLNSGFRGQDKPTNVLAFPAAKPVIPDLPDEDVELGDLVICQDVVAREAAEQSKQVPDHFAHLVIHGTLHLVGYDHQDDTEASKMEALETSVMQSLGLSDPY